MISVAAAAVIAGTGFANAQGTGTEHNAPSAEHAAPSAAPMNRNDAQGKAAARSEQRMQNQHARGGMKANPGDEKSAQENATKQPKGMRAQTDERGSAGKDMKAEGRNGNINAESKGAAEGKAQTVGQAGAGAKLSSEQRTEISSVIREQHVRPMTNVSFSISVGTRVPRDVSFHPLPPEVVTYYPEWRGYEFILVNEQIVVIDPGTYEIAAVIEARFRRARRPGRAEMSALSHEPTKGLRRARRFIPGVG
jgi:hypothetical protein